MIAAFLTSLYRHNPDDAQTVLASAAPLPTADQVHTYSASIGADTHWCAHIQATSTGARYVVRTDLTSAHTGTQQLPPLTFYVSSATAGVWAIDAIVAEGSTT